MRAGVDIHFRVLAVTPVAEGHQIGGVLRFMAVGVAVFASDIATGTHGVSFGGEPCDPPPATFARKTF